MKNNKLYYLNLFLLFAFVFIICVCLYGYNSGSCKINKKYICNNDFCLYKEFNVYLHDVIKNEINGLINKDTIK